LLVEMVTFNIQILKVTGLRLEIPPHPVREEKRSVESVVKKPGDVELGRATKILPQLQAVHGQFFQEML